MKKNACGSVANWFFPVSNKDQFLFRYASDVIFFFNVYAMHASWHGVFSGSEPLSYGVPT